MSEVSRFALAKKGNETLYFRSVQYTRSSLGRKSRDLVARSSSCTSNSRSGEKPEIIPTVKEGG